MHGPSVFRNSKHPKGENMAADRDVVASVGAHLGRLGALCDTGFALAIHIRLTAPTLLYQTYRPEWGDYYSTKGFMLSDPVVVWGLTHTGRVVWSDLVGVDSEGVIAAAVSFGLTNGWTYATTTDHSRTIAGLTRTGRAHTEAEVAEIVAIVDNLHLLTAHFDDLPHTVQDKLRHL